MSLQHELDLVFFMSKKQSFCNKFLPPSVIAVRELPLSTSTPRGGGGVGPKADIRLEISKGGCVNLRTRRGGGPKTRNFCGRT